MNFHPLYSKRKAKFFWKLTTSLAYHRIFSLHPNMRPDQLAKMICANESQRVICTIHSSNSVMYPKGICIQRYVLRAFKILSVFLLQSFVTLERILPLALINSSTVIYTRFLIYCIPTLTNYINSIRLKTDSVCKDIVHVDNKN